MKVLFHGYILSTAGEIEDFLPRFLPCSSKVFYTGLYGHISDFEHFFPTLDIHSKTKFSSLYPIII